MATARTKKFWALYFGSAFVLFIIILITGIVYYRQEAASQINPAFTVASKGSVYNVTQLKQQDTLLNVGIGFRTFSAEKGLKAEIAFQPQNKLSTAQGEPNVPVCVTYRDAKDTDLEFKPFEEMGVESATVSFSGDPNLYPFDVYVGQLIIHAHTGPDNKTCNVPLPINPSVMGTAEAFVVTAQVFPAYNDDNSFDYSSARIEFTARRTRVHQGFAMLIFMVMWTLTLLLSYITLWTWKGGKRVEMGIISLNSALLLSIPRVRDAQPGIPKLGIYQDMYGYCWNVLIVAISLFSLQLNYVLRKERKKDFRKTREDGSTMLQVLEEILDDGAEPPPPIF